MEAKQFPEKWAVLDTNEALVVLKRLFDNRLIDANGNYGFFEEGNNQGFHCYGIKLQYQYKPFADGYTEVTLEDLIAHYEGKKMVRCVDNSEEEKCLIIGKVYALEKEDLKHYYIIDEKNILFGHYKYHFERETNQEVSTTHPKWRPLTRGGYEYKIYEEVGELLFGSLKMINGTYIPTTWKLNGRWGSQEYDLIPYNPRIAELEEKIESKRSELADLESELNTLKGK